MIRARAASALAVGLLLGASGCVSTTGHQVATRPYRPPGQGTLTMADLVGQGPMTNRPPQGAERFFPGLAARTPSGAVRPEPAAGAMPRLAQAPADDAVPSAPREATPEALPASIDVEAYREPPAPGALVADRPRDDASRVIRTAAESEAEPDDAPSAIAESGARPGQEDAPSPVAEARRAGLPNPNTDPALAGRPRMPLIRPNNVPPGLPAATFPGAYYANGVATAPAPARGEEPRPPAEVQVPTPRRRPWRLHLLDRLRGPAIEPVSARREPGDGPQGR
jgi:hypothetical protein